MRAPACTAAALALLALTLAGCGDDRLWARWQAERALLAAQRDADRVLVRPASASPAAWNRADRGYLRVADGWPAAKWASRGSIGRDIAAISGRATLSLASLRRLRGDSQGALEAWQRAGREWEGVEDVALYAAVGEATALEALGRFDDALPVWGRVATAFPLVDFQSARPNADVLEAPLRLARELRQRGRFAEADTVLTAAYARVREAIRPVKPPPELALAASDYAAALGDFDGSMSALRRLAGAGAGQTRVRMAALALADRALELGRPESTLAYARWALQMRGRSAGRARLLMGEAWSAIGRPDSALDQFAQVIEMPRDPEVLVPSARWARGVIFEQQGRWEQARVEWSALQASSPTHELAFRSLLRIVQHHEARGELELARREAESAMTHLQRLLATNADPGVQREANGVLARLIERHGSADDAIRALGNLWRRWPADSLAEAAALDGARLAARTPGELPRADSLYRALAAAARHVEIRQAAAREWEHAR